LDYTVLILRKGEYNMSVNMNLRKILRESAEAVGDFDDGNEIDSALEKNDLEEVLDKAEPIKGDVAQEIQEQMANPDYLRIICDEDNKFYMDYNELVNFCEATGMMVEEAADTIIMHYEEEFDMTKKNLYIVFPSKSTYMEAAETDELGYEDIKWSSHFMQDCENAGLQLTTFLDPGLEPDDDKPEDPVDALEDEDDPATNTPSEVMEGYYGDTKGTKTSKTVEGAKFNWVKFTSAIQKVEFDSVAQLEKQINKIDTGIEKLDKEIDKVKSEDKGDTKARIKTQRLQSILKFSLASLILYTKKNNERGATVGQRLVAAGVDGIMFGVISTSRDRYLKELKNSRENLVRVKKVLEDKKKDIG